VNKNPPKYRDWMPDYLIELGKQGKTIVQCAVAFSDKLREEDPALGGLSRQSLHNWSHDSNKPEFMDAWTMYKDYLEDWWISLGTQGVMGLLPGKFNVIGFIYMMKCLFKENWLADQKQTHEVTGNNISTMSDEELTTHIVSKINYKLQDKQSKMKIVVNNDKP
jgi:hypothetical protein